MAIAYLTHQGLDVRLRHGVLQLRCDDQRVGVLPLEHVTAVVAYGRIAFSTAALTAMARKGVRCVIASRTGRLRAVVLSPVDGAAPCRIGQHRCLADPERCLDLARSVVRSKLRACTALIDRYHANRPELDLVPHARAIRSIADRVPHARMVDELLGLEGAGSREYWAAFRVLNCSPIRFEGRRARPPADPVNALLSFGYAVLAAELITLLHAAGLDPAVGFYHTPHRGRPSLALDAMEPLRHGIIDRLVLGAVNTGRFRPDDFQPGPQGGIWLAPKARATLLRLYEGAMLSDVPADLVIPGTDADDLRGHVIKRIECLARYFRRHARSAPGSSGEQRAAA